MFPPFSDFNCIVLRAASARCSTSIGSAALNLAFGVGSTEPTVKKIRTFATFAWSTVYLIIIMIVIIILLIRIINALKQTKTFTTATFER